MHGLLFSCQPLQGVALLRHFYTNALVGTVACFMPYAVYLDAYMHLSQKQSSLAFSLLIRCLTWYFLAMNTTNATNVSLPALFHNVYNTLHLSRGLTLKPLSSKKVASYAYVCLLF